MSIFQISVGGMILLVGATAVGLAALTSPNEETANGLFTIAGGSLLFAVLAVMYRDDHRRAFWLGFAVFGSAYVFACYGPFGGSAMRPRLLTTTLIDRLYARMNPALQDQLDEIVSRNPDFAKCKWHIRFDQEDDPDADSVALTAIGYRATTEYSVPFYPPPTCSNLVWFRKSAHAIATLWVAFLGGLAGRYLEATRRVSPRASSSQLA